MKKSTKILIVFCVLLGIAFAVQKLTFTTSTTENLHPFASLDTSRISQISIDNRSDEKKIVISREDHGWFIVKPIHFPASRSDVSLLLSAFAGDPAASAMSDNLADTLAYGLNSSGSLLTVFQGAEKRMSIRIGNLTPDFEDCYILIDGIKKILETKADIRTYATQSLTNWRDKRIFYFSMGEVQIADFAINDTLYHFVDIDTAWQLNGKNIPSSRVQNAIGSFIGSMALGFVDTSISGIQSTINFGFSLFNGSRVTGDLMKLGNEFYISNSSNGQVYSVGPSLSADLEQGLKSIRGAYTSK